MRPNISFFLLIFLLFSIASCAQVKKQSLDTVSIKNGIYKEYFENKKVKIIANYKNNLLDGEYKTFYDNGNLESNCFFNEGKKDGKWKHYYSNGKLRGITIFDNNQTIWMGKFDEFGELKMAEIFVNGISKYVFMYDKGLITSEGSSH